jgi:hypothetical protein
MCYNNDANEQVVCSNTNSKYSTHKIIDTLAKDD